VSRSLGEPLFIAIAAPIGEVIAPASKHRIPRVLREIDASVPAEMPIHLIMDNYPTHKIEKVRAWLAGRPRYNIYFTPTSASWLNLVERFFSTLSERWIKRQAHVSVKELEASIEHYL
jgi:transposase